MKQANSGATAFEKMLRKKVNLLYKQRKAGIIANSEWLNGFIMAGIITETMSTADINEIITTAQRKYPARNSTHENQKLLSSPIENIDESCYEIPAFERKLARAKDVKENQ